jgi:hypothetical protein
MCRHLEVTNPVTAALSRVALAILAAGTFCLPASAQALDRPAQAAVFFDEAKTMMDSGNFAEACPKLAESESLDPQVGTMLNLALCYEALGKTASGCLMWRDAAVAAARKLQSDREKLARDRAEKVCSRAPQIAVDVAPQSGRGHVEVTINDVLLPRERWGTSQPFDSGEYELRATGEGLRAWSSKVVVDETHPALVVVPVLAPVSNDSTTPSAPAPDRTARGLTIAGWATGVGGLAAVGVGSAFGVAAMVDDSAANRAHDCVRDTCNPAGESERQRAIDDARAADVMLAVGAGAVATGVVLWLVGSHAPRRAAGFYVQPAVAERACALSIGQVW